MHAFTKSGKTDKLKSHELPRFTVTNQIAFDQQDVHSTPEFEYAIDRRCRYLTALSNVI